MTPEQTIVALRRADGTVSLMAFLTVARGNVLPRGASWLDERQGVWLRPASAVNIEAEIAAVVAAEGIGVLSWRIIVKPELEVPQDRTFRDAWADDGKAITHDMAKAREIKRKHIRAARVMALRDLDGQWMRAAGQGKKAEQDAVEAERQKWRDAPADPRIDAAQTVEALKQITVG